MMLYEHGDLIFKSGHRRFHTVHPGAYRFHVTPQLFKRKLYGVHGLAVGNRFHPALELFDAIAEFGHGLLRVVVFRSGRKTSGQVIDAPAVDECGEYSEHRPPAVKLSQYVGHGSLHHYRR